MSPHFLLARRLALGIPALLLAGAYISQYGFGLYPCDLCWYQRYPHFAAIALALLGTVAAPQRVWVALAALAILASGLIGGFHAGVEYGWWEGLSTCSSAPGAGSGDPMRDLMERSIIRCDEAPWRFLGVSLAGFNFLISTAAALAILALLGRDRTTGAPT